MTILGRLLFCLLQSPGALCPSVISMEHLSLAALSAGNPGMNKAVALERALEAGGMNLCFLWPIQLYF